MQQQCTVPTEVSVEELTNSLMMGDPVPTSRLFHAQGLDAAEVVWAPCSKGTGSEKLGFLIDYWHEARRDDALPTCDAIDPVALKPVLGHVLVCEPVDGGQDFLIRLYGTKMAQSMGRDLTGERVSRFQPDSYINAFILATYRAVAQRREPLFTRHWPSQQAIFKEIPRVLLPFMRNGKVSRILACTDTTPKTPTVRRRWEIAEAR